jgi:hypothetical protein
MKKKHRSPDKPQASPNPRPKRRNKKQRESMVKPKRKDSPPGTPLQTPIQTPERRTQGNSFEPLQNDSDGEEASQTTINADDRQVEIKSEQSDSEPASSSISVNQPSLTEEVPAPIPTPDDVKQRSTSSGPIAEILPTNAERLHTSVPIFASEFDNTMGELFPETSNQKPVRTSTPTQESVTHTQRTMKPPPVASLLNPAASPVVPDKFANSHANSGKGLSKQEDRDLANELFDQDSKPAAVNHRQHTMAEAIPPPKRIQADLIVESNKLKSLNSATSVSITQAMDIDNETDPVENLNRSIAQQKAHLDQLQSSLAALKASQVPSESETIDMEEEPFIPVSVGHKKSTTIPPTSQSVQSVSLLPAASRVRDPLTELATKRPIYPKLPEPSPRRPFTQRFSWRIDIPKADTPAAALIEGISEIWTVLKEADEKLIIYPWKAKNFATSKALSGPSKLQNATKEFINRYFPDAYFRPQPGTMYLNVYVGSSISYEELGKRTQYFFGSNSNRTRIGIWKNAIPFEDVVEIGWLFRSTPGMSAEQIQKELLGHTGIHAALRWKLISIGVKGKLTEELESRALHISVRRDDCNLAKAKFTKLVFARHRRSHFIGGSPMRLIPLYKDVSPRNKIKCVHYAGRQQNFLKEIMIADMFDILQIDIHSVGLNGRTLRELILEIPLRDSPTRQAFLSADRSFNGSTVKLCFYAKNDSECRSRMATLLPYLVFTNPRLEKGIRGCFSADANERAKGVKWDDQKKDVVTVDDEIFESFEALDSDDEADNQKPRVQQFMINFVAASGLTALNKKSPPGPAIKVQEGDAASLFSQSTMRSKKADSSDESDDTPKTINKSPPTAQTEALSSLSEGVSFELKTKLEQMTSALLQLTAMIPDSPENQAALANIRAILPQSQSAGSSSDVVKPGSSGSGTLPV